MERNDIYGDSFHLYSNGQHLASVTPWKEMAPKVRFDSPVEAYAQWAFPRTEIFGHVDCSGAEVSGLNLEGGVSIGVENGALKITVGHSTWYLNEEGWEKK